MDYILAAGMYVVYGVFTLAVLAIPVGVVVAVVRFL